MVAFENKIEETPSREKIGTDRMQFLQNQTAAAFRSSATTMPNYTNKERDWSYSYNAYKYMYDNVNEIYRGAEDPREALSDTIVGNVIHNLFPEISLETAQKNARSLVYGMTGDDMSSSNVLEVAYEKVKQGLTSLGVGFQNLKFLWDYGTTEGLDPLIDQQKYKEQQDTINRKLGNLKRTDYYNKDFDSFIDKMVLSAADFIPSEITSLIPTAVGGALSALTGMPLFFNIGSFASGVLAGVMEAGSASVELAQAGADFSVQRGASTIVGLANGTLEWLGNVAERGTVSSIFNIDKLYKAVGDSQISKTTAREFAKHLLTEYAVNLVSEPATEGLQDFTQMLVMNLASEWQEKNTGKSFSEEFTYTPDEMAKGVWDTVKSTFRGQMLIGLGGGVVDTISNLGYHLDTTNGIGNWKWEAGQLRQAIDVNKYSTHNADSIFVGNDNVLVGNVKAYSPTVTENEKGKTSVDKISPVNVVRFNGSLLPASAEDIAKAKYMQENSKYGMYVNVIGEEADSSVQKATYDDAQGLAGNLPKDLNIFVADTGDIEVNSSDFNKAVLDIIDVLGSAYQGIDEIAEGLEYDIYAGDKKYTVSANISENAKAVTGQSVLDSIKKMKGSRAIYLSKDFNKNLRSTFRKAGFIGEGLDRTVNDYTELAKNIRGTVSELAKQMKAKNEFAESDIEDKLVYGIAGMVAKFQNVLGYNSEWAKDHVVIDSTLGEGRHEGTSVVDYGWSQWQVGDKKYKNYSEIPMANRDKAQFHIALTEMADATTGIHEIGHMALSLGEQKFMNDADFKKAFYSYLEKDNNGVDEANWKIGDTTHEAFANLLEEYIMTGVAENKEQASLFSKILAAVKMFFDMIKKSLTDEQKDFYDKLFGEGLDENEGIEEIYDPYGSAEADAFWANNPERHKQFYLGALSDAERDDIYNNFYDSYMKSVGSSWDRDTFDWKAGKWTFFGSVDGGIALRRQNSGMYKLNASYGSTKEIFKAVKEIVNTIGDQPIWGAMTEPIADMLEKATGRFGNDVAFLKVPKLVSKLIAPSLTKIMGGNVTVNNDGTLTAMTPDGKEITKVLVANKAYYQRMIDQMENNPDSLPIPKLAQRAAVGALKLFYGKNYLPQNTEADNSVDARYPGHEEVEKELPVLSEEPQEVRYKRAVDYTLDYAYNNYRLRQKIEGQDYSALDEAFRSDADYVKAIVSNIENMLGRSELLEYIAIIGDSIDVDNLNYAPWLYYLNETDRRFTEAFQMADEKRQHTDLKDNFIKQGHSWFIDDSLLYAINPTNIAYLTVYVDNIDDFSLMYNLLHSAHRYNTGDQAIAQNGETDYRLYGPDDWEVDNAHGTDFYHHIFLPRGTELVINIEGVNGYEDRSRPMSYNDETGEYTEGRKEYTTELPEIMMKVEREKYGNLLRLGAHHTDAEINGALDTAFIGNGTGYQTYGWVHYISSHPSVGEGYKDEFYDHARARVHSTSRSLTSRVEDFKSRVVGNAFSGYSDQPWFYYEFTPVLSNMPSQNMFKGIESMLEDKAEISFNFAQNNNLDSVNIIADKHDIYEAMLTSWASIESDKLDTLSTLSNTFDNVINALLGNYGNKKGTILSAVDIAPSYVDTAVKNIEEKYTQNEIREYISSSNLYKSNKSVQIENDLLKNILERVVQTKVFEEVLEDTEYLDEVKEMYFGNYYKALLLDTINDIRKQNAIAERGREFSSFDNSHETLLEMDVEISDLLTSGDEEVPIVYNYPQVMEGDDDLFLKWEEKPTEEQIAWIVPVVAQKMNMSEKNVLAALLDDGSANTNTIMPDWFTGKHLYGNLEELCRANYNGERSDKRASLLLADAGIVGMQVPAYNNSDPKGASPNYVIYRNDYTKTLMQQRFAKDSSGNYENVGETTYHDDEFKGRYKKVETEDIQKWELDYINNELANGRMVNGKVVSRYSTKSEWARAEQNASSVIADGRLGWMANLLSNIMVDYFGGNNFTYSDIKESDWEKITKAFIKNGNDKLNEQLKKKSGTENTIVNYFSDKNSDVEKVLKRLYTWIIHTDESQKMVNWLNLFTGRNAKQGEKEIIKLAMKMRDGGYFDDKTVYSDGTEASAKYRFLDLALQNSYTGKNNRHYIETNVSEAVWLGAQQEIMDNAQELMEVYNSTSRVTNGNAQLNGVEDEEIPINYSNITERNLGKARAEAEEYLRQTNEMRNELVDALKENDAIRAEIEETHNVLLDAANSIGLDVDLFTTDKELAEAISTRGEEYKQSAELMEKVNDAISEKNKEKLQKSNDKIRELRNELKVKDANISTLEVKNREKLRQINRLTKRINDLISQNKETIENLNDKNAKKIGKLNKKIEDLMVQLDVLKNQDKVNKKYYDGAIKSLRKATNDWYAELRLNMGLEKKNKIDEAVIKQLDKNLSDTLKELDRQIKLKERYAKELWRRNEEISNLRMQRLVSNTRRNWREMLQRKSGDSILDKALATFDRLFFQRDTSDAIEQAQIRLDSLNEKRDSLLADIANLEKNKERIARLEESITRAENRLQKLSENKAPFKVIDLNNEKNADIKNALMAEGELTDSNGRKYHVGSIYNLLESRGLIEDGKLVKGFSDLEIKDYKAMSDAIRVARDASNGIEQMRAEERKENVENISETVKEDFGGLNLNKQEQEKARRLFVNGEFESLAEAEKAVYAEKTKYYHEGTADQKNRKSKMGFNERKGFNPNNNLIFNSFTSLWNMLGSVSKKLRDFFFFGNEKIGGINQFTDEYLKKSNERVEIANEAIYKFYNATTDKQKRKALNEFYKEAYRKFETRQLDPDSPVVEWLMNQQTWRNFANVDEYDASYVDNTLTLSNIFAVYQHAKQNEDIAHILNDRTNINAWQMAWIVDQFESEDGIFHKYKEIAEAFGTGYDMAFDRFQSVANTVYGIPLTRYEYYTPARSSDPDTDITLGFSFDALGNTSSYGKKLTLAERNDMIEKLGGDNPISLDYIGSFRATVQNQEWFINTAEFFKTWNDVMKNDGGSIRREIDDRFGSGVSDNIIKSMRAVASSEYYDVASGINKFLDMIRNNMALANLGFNISSTLQQPAVLAFGFAKYGAKRMFHALSSLKSFKSIREFVDTVHTLAPQIKMTADENIMYATKAIEEGKVFKAIGVLQEVARFGMKGIEKLDQISRCIMWQAAYEYYQEKGLSLEDANVRATQDTLNMNSSRQAKDNAIVYNSKNPLMRTMLLFTNQLNKQWNMLIGEDGIPAIFSDRWKNGLATILGLGLSTSWILFIKGKMINNDDDDEEWWEDLWIDYFGEGISVVPVIGDKISGIVNGYSYLDSDLVRSTSTFIKQVFADDKGNKDQKVRTAAKNAMVDLLELAGAPKIPFKNTYNSLFESGKWKGDEWFTENRYWGVVLPYEWYQYIKDEK